MSQPNVLHAPWEADGHAIFDAYSVMVASVGLASRTRDDAHEIARLIAAAPELLEALRPFAEWYHHIHATGSRRLEDNEWPPASGMPKIGALKAVRAAIAKATGGAK